jgi:hypothetical protein
MEDKPTKTKPPVENRIIVQPKEKDLEHEQSWVAEARVIPSPPMK